MNRLLSIIIFFIPPFAACGQVIQPLAAVKAPGTFRMATDRAGDLYVIAADHIEKYSPEGVLQHTYDQANISSFDPGNSVRMLIYDHLNQSYAILSPSLTLLQERALDPDWAFEPVLLCISSNYNLWILDAADWSLKKIDERNNIVLLETPLDSLPEIPEFAYMREYQNFLFVLEKNQGLMIFNMLGKLIHTFSPGIRDFNFFGEELYYVQGDRIIFFNLFTGENRSTRLTTQGDEIVLTDLRKYIRNNGLIEFYPFTPAKTTLQKD